MTEATGPHNVGQTNMNSVCSIGKVKFETEKSYY